jgi:1-acyl-sn-glycerol-3-phosphate acyltransferase
MMKELPNLRCHLADLSAAPTDEELSALLQEFISEKGGGESQEEEVAFRDGDRFVRRLRPTKLSDIAAAAPAIQADHEAQWRAEILTVGSLDSIVFRRTPRQEPGPLQVEVAIKAASLNFRDVVLATGAIAGLESEDSFGDRTLGLDLAGVVTRCGEEVTHLRPGDEVFGTARGAFASYAITHSALLVRKPARLSQEQAASVPVAFVTAHYALRYLAHLSRGESILIHAASGGVGLAAVQMAKMVGARIFATAGNPEKRAYLESLGVSKAMDSRTLTFAEEILELTDGRGVDVILNSLSGEAIDRGIQALAPYGRFIELGKLDILQNNRVQLLPFKRNLSYFALDLDRMCHERPNLVGQLLQEVAEELSTGVLDPIPCTGFPMKELSAAMRFMAQAKQIGKVVVRNEGVMEVRDATPEKPPVRADATYLISGGLGGVGLLTARMLVEHGARNLVLMGRTLRVEADLTLRELRAAGARIEMLAADVANPMDVARALKFIRAELPPLRGIVHAAMVLEDTSLALIDQDGLNRVMAPKVAGAWNLHQLTRGESLDFFISYSSIASLLGNALQASYASANAFLDSFAIYRRRLGMPATTINWGVISGSGYVARHPEIEETLNRQGYLSFTEDQVMTVASQMLRHDAVHVMAARIDWKRLQEFAPRAASSPRLRHLVPATVSNHTAAAGLPLRRMLDEDGSAERRSRLEKYLQEQVGRLLGTRPGAVDGARPITDFGLDSLIAVELTVVLERDLGVRIQSAQLLSGISIETLVTEILNDLYKLGVHDEKLIAAKPPSQKAEVQRTLTQDEMKVDGPEQVTENPAMQHSQVLPSHRAADVGQNGTRVVERVNYGGLDHRSWTAGQQAVRMVASAGFKLLGCIRTQGFENIPSDGPCLLVVNHLSMADVPLVLTLLPRRAIVLANIRLKQNRLLDWFLSDMGQAIYVKKNQNDDEPLQEALTVLRSNGLVAMAPEGTRSKAGGLLQGNMGAAYLATQVDVPVVPLVAWGQEKWRERGTRIRRIPIEVRVGPPLRFPQDPISAPMMRAHTNKIMTTLAAMLPPEYRGVYADLAAEEENRELARAGSNS